MPVIQGLSQKCIAAGRPPIATDLYGDPLNTYLALANGRGDAYMVAKAPGIYIAKRFLRLAVTPGVLEGHASTSGFVIAKNRPGLRRALTLAMKSAIADGSYQAVLRKYGLQDGAVSASALDLARPAH
ncbi:hypothetical protein [Sphingobium arseniciresistens]|uniref:hypothetical protein n=1 Tax=Sphingobium arseniciresistens TaxID=3030834 RepID=UPI003BAF0AC2